MNVRKQLLIKLKVRLLSGHRGIALQQEINVVEKAWGSISNDINKNATLPWSLTSLWSVTDTVNDIINAVNNIVFVLLQLVCLFFFTASWSFWPRTIPKATRGLPSLNLFHCCFRLISLSFKPCFRLISLSFKPERATFLQRFATL